MDGHNKVNSYSVKKQSRFFLVIRKALRNKKFKKLFIILSIVLLLVITLLVLNYKFLGPALTIGDKKISKLTYNNLVKQGKEEGLKETDIKDKIIRAEKKKIAAQKLNISYTESQLNELITKSYGVEPSKANDWQKLNTEEALITVRVRQIEKGGYVGSIFFFPFSRNFYSTVFPQNAPFGDEKTISEDRAYADNKAKEYRQKLIENKITSEQAITEIIKDEKLILGPSSNLSQSFVLDENGVSSKNGESVFDSTLKEYISVIKSLKPGDISQIQMHKSVIPYDTIGLPYKTQVQKDVEFYFIKLDSNNKADSEIDYKFTKEVDSIRVRK